MKTSTLALVATSLVSLASAQPHRRHVHAHQNAKKDDVVVIVDTVYAQVQAPDVIVYVDQDGNLLSTTTQGVDSTPSILSHAPISTILPSTSSTPTPSSSSTPTTSSTFSTSTTSVASVAPIVPTVDAVASSAAPVVSSVVAAVSSAVAPIVSAVTTPESGGYGVSYAPFYANGGCKTQADVNTDVKSFVGSYSLVRIYGTSCDQVAKVLSAVNTYNLKLFAGVESLGDLSSEIALIISAANGDWSRFDTIAIGNELVNSGIASASAVVAGISSARSQLGSAGYTGKIVTVDTLAATLTNPTLCDHSDYCAVNNHPFFDSNTAASQAGSFLQTSIATLKSKLANPSQEIVITETGWPWNGNANGAAVPSLANQEAALSSIQSAYSSGVIFLSAYNDKWKTNSASTFNAEQYWGKGGADSPTG